MHRKYYKVDLGFDDDNENEQDEELDENEEEEDLENDPVPLGQIEEN